MLGPPGEGISAAAWLAGNNSTWLTDTHSTNLSGSGSRLCPNTKQFQSLKPERLYRCVYGTWEIVDVIISQQD